MTADNVAMSRKAWCRALRELPRKLHSARWTLLLLSDGPMSADGVIEEFQSVLAEQINLAPQTLSGT